MNKEKELRNIEKQQVKDAADKEKKRIRKEDSDRRREYIYSLGEEIANATTHGPMALFCLCILPFCSVWAYLHGGENKIVAAVSVSIFVISLFLMFMSSTLYHIMKQDTSYKRAFKILDHIFIYVAIAGSYTPIALYIVGGWQGILITSIQWTMVMFGIFYKSLLRRSIPKLSLTIYLVMGWTIVFFFPLFLNNSNPILISLIGGGGLMYTIGAIFYAMKNFKYHHMVWHLFINLGAIAHFIGIVFYMY